MNQIRKQLLMLQQEYIDFLKQNIEPEHAKGMICLDVYDLFQKIECIEGTTNITKAKKISNKEWLLLLSNDFNYTIIKRSLE